MHERRRQQLVEWLVAGLVGAVLLLLSDLLVPAAGAPFPGHGERFVEIAQHPWSFAGMFPHRILWPLLANWAGQLGIGPVAFSQVTNAALLMVVFWFCRQRHASWFGAGLVTAAVAASGAVLVYKPMVCLSDSLNLLLLVLTVHFQARLVVFWGLVLLASLSHEMVFFFWPWLLWLRRTAGGSLVRDGAALGLTLAGYAAWRLLVKAMVPAGAPVVAYDAAYYIQNNFWVPWGLPAMWGLWAFVVLVEFGPLLVVVIAAWRRRQLAMGGSVGPWLYLGCVLLLMLLAYDVMRFATFAFLPVVLGGLAVVRSPRACWVFVALLAAACMTYVWQHPIPSEQGGRVFTDVSGHIRELLLAGKGLGTPGEAAAFTGELLLRDWRVAFAGVVATSAIVVLGLWLARCLGPVGEPADADRDAAP